MKFTLFDKIKIILKYYGMKGYNLLGGNCSLNSVNVDFNSSQWNFLDVNFLCRLVLENTIHFT